MVVGEKNVHILWGVQQGIRGKADKKSVGRSGRISFKKTRGEGREGADKKSPREEKLARRLFQSEIDPSTL